MAYRPTNAELKISRCLAQGDAAIHSNDWRVIGFNNIKLITNLPFQTNIDEMRQIKKD